MAHPKATENRLDGLPNEILLEVLKSCDGIDGLGSLTKAVPQAHRLFEAYANEVFKGVMAHCTMHPHLKKMLCMIISLRHYRDYYTPMDALQKYTTVYALDTSVDARIDFEHRLQPSEANALLEGAVELCDNIARIEKSFISTRRDRIMSRVRGYAIVDRYYRKDGFKWKIPSKERPISLEEHHRIRRALWRLHLYYEVFFIPFVITDDREEEDTYFQRIAQSLYIEMIRNDKKKGSQYECQVQSSYFMQMTAWELEELECVWYHVQQDPTDYWIERCSYCRSFLLPDDLLFHQIHDCRDKFVHSCGFGKSCTSFRSILEGAVYTCCEDTTRHPAAWPDDLAKEPSAGYIFLLDHQTAIRPGEPSLREMRGPLTEFLVWGYCMWDQKRLEAWRMIDNEAGTVLADLVRWRDLWKCRPGCHPWLRRPRRGRTYTGQGYMRRHPRHCHNPKQHDLHNGRPMRHHPGPRRWIGKWETSPSWPF